MDIRKWPIDRIMQLPDCCFGRRWLISCAARGLAGAPAWDISEIGFPERIVLWEFGFWCADVLSIDDRWRLALGDKLPITTAEMDALEPFIPGFGLQGAEPRGSWIPQTSQIAFRRLRQPIQTAGRRLVLEVAPVAATNKSLVVGVVISSMPTEVPDWLFSGPGRNLL